MADLNVLCSCGAVGVITCSDGRYVTLTPGWLFDPGSSGDPPEVDNARLWYCGQPGHFQKAVARASKNGGCKVP